jgi:pyruvate kinase
VVGVVQSISGLEAKINIKMGGKIKTDSKVRLLGSKHSHMPVISDADIADLAQFSQLALIDFLVVPFVYSAEDIQQVRAKLGPHGSKIKLFAKIDSVEAVKNFE